MSYVQGYEFDLFVSYAHVDNASIEPAEHGWVDALFRILDSNLAMKLGRKEAFSIWRDSQNLRGNQEISGYIADKVVKNSAIFLAILSPGYLASKYCLQELQTFVQNIKRNPTQRLFVVYKDPIDEYSMPEAFRDLRKYQFWIRDLNQKPRVLGWPLPRDEVTEDRRHYYPKVGDLAEDIVAKLGELAKAALVSRLPAEPCRREHTELVLLAEVTDDLDARREEMRRYLEQAGVGALPTGAYRLSRTEFERSVSADLERCKAFVQLLGPIEGKCPPDVPEGFTRLQFDLARSTSMPILQWRSPDLNVMEVSSAAQRQLLQAETVQAMPFEEFKRTIVDAVTRMDQPKSESPSFVFVNAAPVDIDRAWTLVHVLEDSLEWEMPLYESDARAEKIQNECQTGLIDCDGLIILHGEVGANWVVGQLQQYRKLAPRRAKDLRLLAIVSASKEAARTPIPIKLRGMMTLPFEEAAARIKAAFAR